MLSNAVAHGFAVSRGACDDAARGLSLFTFGHRYGPAAWIAPRDSTTGDTLIHHGGAIQGQRAFMIGDVNARVGVYYMTNSDYLPDAVPPSELADAALKLLVLPALVLVIGRWVIGLQGLPLAVVVMMAAMPVGSNALIERRYAEVFR